MKIIYSDHAKKRLRQRGISELEVKQILDHPDYIKKSFEGRKEAVGEVRNRLIKIEFIEKDNYLKIITII